MKTTLHLMIASAALLGAAAVQADVATTPVLKEPGEVGQWLELQKGGKAASTQAQPLNGEMMTKAYQRHLKTFEQAIPAKFSSEPVGAGGSGGGK
jgi:hypothetical protein